MTSSEDIVRALAAIPNEQLVDLADCACPLCTTGPYATANHSEKDHQDDCPWARARAWVEAADGPSTREDAK